MKKKWTCLMMFFWMIASSSGQMLVQSGTVLASARQDLVLNLQTQQITYIQENNRNLPFLDQISLRTETDRFDLSRQEYIARFEVNGFSEMHQQRLLQGSGVSAKESLQRVYWHEALVVRYQSIASYRHIQRELAILLAFEQVYKDKVNVLKKMAALNAWPDVDELIKAEFELDNLTLKISASEALLEQLKFSIQALMAPDSNTWQLDTSDFITPEQIEVAVAEIPESILENPEIVEKQIKIDQLNAAYAYEKAQSNKVLDFFQVRYANLPLAPLERELSLGLAINLPFKGTSRVNMSELTISQNAASQNMQLYLIEATRQVADSKLRVEALGRRFRLAREQWQVSQARYTIENPEDAKAEGPLTLLNARELQLKRQLNLLDMERDMLDQYLKILDLTGRLSATPPVNYLSKEFSEY